MRKLFFLVSILLTVTLSADTSIFELKTEKPKPTNNKELCKLFKEKAAAYETTMRDDGYAQATLQSYKDRAALYCKE